MNYRSVKSFLTGIKKLNRLFTAVLVLSLFLNFFPASFKDAEAQSFSFPKLGSSTLEDPEGYEKVNLIERAGLLLTGYTPAKTETFDKTYYGFSLSGDFEGVIFRAKKGNDTFTDYLKAEREDTFYGNDTSFDTSNASTSELFIFSEGVKEVEFYYTGEKNFNVNKYEFSTGSASTSVKPSEFASTPAEVAYKEKLFSQMGFNLITREEWGAPTASPWAPTIANVNRVVVHHTATSVDMANPKNTVLAVYNYHYYRCADNSGSYNPSNPAPNCDEQSEWWTDVGYNYMIDPYGNIYEGRSGGNGVVGAHAIPNTGSIGISILGNYVSQDPTQASMEALTRLVSAVTQLNNFNAVWHGGDPASATGLYGHKDLAATACPARIYNQLSTVAGLAIQMKPVNSTLQNVDSTRNELINNRDYVIEGTKAQVVLDSTSLSAITKEKLLTQSRGVEKVTEIGNKIIYTVDNSKIDQLIAETLLVAPESNAQPNFVYKLETWDNTDPNRSIPSDYDVTTHWTAEKIKLPEAWKEMGGCTVDNSCGGSPSVVVAVLDTGLAYENFSYDVGDDDTYTVEKFAGIYIEYPTNDTLDGTFVNAEYKGYERQYAQSSEMNGVNIVSPYDAVQDLFCGLRSLDGNPSNNCNTAELAKINHPNDDYGHGTFVTTIIAGKTSDIAPNKVVGIAHNVSIMPIKVFYPNDRSMCQDSSGNLDLTCSNPDRDYRVVGDSFVISNAIDYAVANGADVINMSLRGIGTDPMMEAAVDDAAAAGVVVVAAAGNDNSDIANYFPASFENVIAVGATNSSDTRASYSNFGDELDLVAPVGDSGPKIASQSYSCYSSINNCSDETNATLFSSFTSNSTPTTGIGTSFAAPQVSAAAALAKSISPTLNFYQMYNLLTHNATVLGGDVNTQTGFGLLNIDSSLKHLNDTVLSTSNPNFNPSSNGDNMSDIIAYYNRSTQVDVTPSTGTNFGGGFAGFEVWDAKTYHDEPKWTFIGSADVNGDGKKDIIFYYSVTRQVNVLLSDGTKYKHFQVWNKDTKYDATNWRFLKPADVNNDGKADLIAYYAAQKQVDVTLSDGLTFGGGAENYQVWNTNTAYDTTWTLLNPSDVDADGDADLIAYKASTKQVNVTPSTGTNFGGGNGGSVVWNSNTAYDTTNWRLLAPVDVNNDEQADLIAYRPATTQINVTLSTGTDFGGGVGGSQIWNTRTYYDTSNWILLTPTDVTGDGMADIVAYRPATTQINVTPSTGTNFGGGNGGSQIWNTKTFYDSTNWKFF